MGVFLSQAGWAGDCVYFRVSYKLTECREATSQEVTDPASYVRTSDVPELPPPEAGRLVKISCSCDYSLSGSDLRCDFDKTIERSTLLGSESPTEVCRRGKILCEDACPRDLH